MGDFLTSLCLYYSERNILYMKNMKRVLFLHFVQDGV